MNEVELKFLEINVAEIQRKLESIGAKKQYESEIYDVYFENEKLGFHHYKSNKKTLRVREVNGKVTITYKGPRAEGHIKMREEREIIVEDFGNALKLLEQLGFSKVHETRKQRIHYTRDEEAFELDTVSTIPTYLEIETQSIQRMKAVCEELGLRIEDGHGKTIKEIYPNLGD